MAATLLSSNSSIILQQTTLLGVVPKQKRFLTRRIQKRGWNRLVVVGVTQGSADSKKSEESIPSWAKPDSEEPPPWARDEFNNNVSQQGFVLPFYVYLLASAIIAIAAVSSFLLLNFIISSLLYSYVIYACFVLFLNADWFYFRVRQPKTRLWSFELRQHFLCSLAWILCVYWHSPLCKYSN